MWTLRPKRGEIPRIVKQYRVTQAKTTVLGIFLHQQVLDRFSTAGVSGGDPWPSPKWTTSIGSPDGRAILTGATGDLLHSFNGYGVGSKAIVDSVSPYAHVHQYGTTGKGGTLPTIRPKAAKALFIPLTDKAINSERLTGPAAALLKVGLRGGVRWAQSPIRAHGRSVGYKPGKSLGMTVYEPLIRGRIKDGKLQGWDPILGWTDKKPDFIFLKKVDIPPRRMLPKGEPEKLAQKRLIVSLFGPPRNNARQSP